MAVIKVRWTVDELENVMTQFDTQTVYRSTTGETGVYSEITGVGTRVDLVAGQTSYYFDDLTGDDTYFYKVGYLNTGTLAESTLTDPISGETAQNPALEVISIEELKEIYLFGIDLTRDDGTPYPDSLYEHYIASAVASLEVKLDIHILPVEITEEKHDYYREDWEHFMYLFLKEYPVISIEEMKLVYPNNNDILDIELSDIHLRNESGQLQVVPAIGTNYEYVFTGTMLGATPIYFRGARNIPDFFRVSYTAGLDPIPANIKDCVGKIASFGPLNIAGDLLGGAGIASQSISMDGLSQSFNTTSSATNAGYGARLLSYRTELREVIPELRRYYKGLRLTVI